MADIILNYELIGNEMKFSFSKKGLFGSKRPTLEEINAARVKNVNKKYINNFAKTSLLDLADNSKSTYDEFFVNCSDLYNIDEENNVYESFLENLGFPEVMVRLCINNTGNVGNKNLELEYKFEYHDRRMCFAERKGIFLVSDGKVVSIISKQMFDLCCLVDQYKSSDTKDGVKLAIKFKEILGQDTSDNVNLSKRSEEYFNNLRIIHCSKFTLDIFSTSDGFDFNPQFISVKQIDGGQREEKLLLTKVQEENFNNEIFPQKSSRSSYILKDGTYLFLDKKIKRSLDLISNIKKSGKETKKEFIKNPKAKLNEYLAEEFVEEDPSLISEDMFIETDSYSDKVDDIGLWIPPVLPWITIKGQKWIPDDDYFGLIVSGKRIFISNAEERDGLKKEIEIAREAGLAIVDFKGTKIPATEDTLTTLGKFTPILKANKPVEEDVIKNIFNESEVEGNGSGKNDKQVLIVKENFDQLLYSKYKKDIRKTPANFSSPLNLKHSLYNYQKECLAWLIESWSIGVSGALLADDMGLGKTFQLLAFLSWVKEFDKRPALIVAPTSLLKNWEDESELHLEAPHLGNLVRLYGSELKYNRRDEMAGSKEYKIAQSVLNINVLKNADWIVTSYETMRDYEISLGKIGFSVIIFDEMQKIKNPKALVTKAAKALNGDFIVGLTGTPVENRLADLHTIIDILRPGFLGPLKDFSKDYEKENVEREKFIELKEKLEGSFENLPKTMVRRLKKDVLTDGTLKSKNIEVLREIMPPEQAREYDAIISEYYKEDDTRSMLEALQKIRNLSLIIEDPTISTKSLEELVNSSARLKKTFEVISDIKLKGEKCIIFLESIKVQKLVRKYVHQLYNFLPDIINGSVPTRERQNMVDRFQKNKNFFDIIILSPKAAGTGFTITAANHVIHLSRWWNPAIEDQATDRAYRIGQKKEVFVYYPIAVHPEYGEDSFDVKLDNLISNKRKLSEELLLPVDAPNTNSETSDLFNDTFKSIKNVIDYSSELTELNDTNQFDDFIEDLFKKAGCNVFKTKQSHDHGVDLIADKNGTRYFIECKFMHKGNEGICKDDFVDRMLKGHVDYDIKGKKVLIGVTNAKDWSHTIKSKARENGVVLYTAQNINQISIKI